jgi:L-lactate dehydrogenase (cytochrome)
MPSSANEENIISDAELAAHKSETSCWLAINGVVYDMTEFLNEHPGGKSILLKYAGSDATRAFSSYHPFSLLELLPKSAIRGLFKRELLTKENSEVREQDPNISLGYILNTYDFARNARRRVSKEAWDYLVSAADDEVTYRENEQSFNNIWIRPRVLLDVSGLIDTSLNLLGRKSAAPIFISATAMGRLYHPDGEVELCRGAYKGKIIQMCPTLGSCSLEEVAKARKPGQGQWFQLYVNTDNVLNEKIIKGAEALGFDALVVTVDVAVLGKRERDQRNKVSDISNVPKAQGNVVDKSQGVSRALSSFVNPGLSWDAIRWFRTLTKLPIILKGIQTKEDALLAARSGIVRGIIVSNHGGRQVDFARPTVDCLEEVILALRTEKSIKINVNFDVYVDGGIRRGTDIFKCLALGAKAVGIGRPAMFALASHGSDGVQHLVNLMTEELRVCMMHTGCRSLNDINRSHIEIRSLASGQPVRYDPNQHESRL